jgi:hypothetical protein
MAAYESIYGAVSVRLRHGTLYNDLIILAEIKIDVKYFLTSIWEIGVRVSPWSVLPFDCG